MPLAYPATAHRCAPATGSRRSTAAYATTRADPAATALAATAPAPPTARRSGRTAPPPLRCPRGLRCSGSSWSTNQLPETSPMPGHRHAQHRQLELNLPETTSIHVLTPSADVVGDQQGDRAERDAAGDHPDRKTEPHQGTAGVDHATDGQDQPEEDGGRGAGDRVVVHAVNARDFPGRRECRAHPDPGWCLRYPASRPRYASTASTRRCPAPSSDGSPSFWKMLRMCLSTAPSLTTSSSAIVLLL